MTMIYSLLIGIEMILSSIILFSTSFFLSTILYEIKRKVKEKDGEDNDDTTTA